MSAKVNGATISYIITHCEVAQIITMHITKIVESKYLSV